MGEVTALTAEEAATLLDQDAMEHLHNQWRFEGPAEDCLLESFLPGQLETGS